MSDLHDIAIVGAGPGGLCAALYCLRAGLSVVLVDRGSPGGQLSNTEAVENYLGIQYMGGPELAAQMAEHVQALGLEVTFAGVDSMTKDSDGFFTLHTDTAPAEVRAKAVIASMGSHPRYLEVPGELEYRTGGVSYCATCDGFFFRGKDVVVIGGGNAAVEEAVYLSKIVKTVTVIHRRDELRAQKVLQDHAFAAPNVSFVWDTVVEEIGGEGGRVTGVNTLNKKTAERGSIPCHGVFIYVGNLPNSELCRGVCDTDENGYVLVDLMMRTSVPGLFAAGDMRVQSVRQIASAVGDGATAACAAIPYVNLL
jgi:thioredoxin reductase (NADPH)